MNFKCSTAELKNLKVRTPTENIVATLAKVNTRPN